MKPGMVVPVTKLVAEPPFIRIEDRVPSRGRARNESAAPDDRSESPSLECVIPNTAAWASAFPRPRRPSPWARARSRRAHAQASRAAWPSWPRTTGAFRGACSGNHAALFGRLRLAPRRRVDLDRIAFEKVRPFPGIRDVDFRQAFEDCRMFAMRGIGEHAQADNECAIGERHRLQGMFARAQAAYCLGLPRREMKSAHRSIPRQAEAQVGVAAGIGRRAARDGADVAGGRAA